MYVNKKINKYIYIYPGSQRPFLTWLIWFCNVNPLVKTMVVGKMVVRLLGCIYIYILYACIQKVPPGPPSRNIVV